jgi:hypothetical protein
MLSADEANRAKLELLNQHLAQNLYNVSQGVSLEGKTIDIGEVNSIQIDKEIAYLMDRLAKEQGISPELALKKALVNSYYIHDIMTNQGGKLFVQYQDNSLTEIIFK